MRIVVLENTRSCNLRCPACPVTYCPDYPKGFMSHQVFVACVKAVDWDSYDGCALTGWGEPLLDPEYFCKLAELKKLGVTVGSTSNMLLVDENTLVRLDGEGLDQLNISVDTLHARAIGIAPRELLSKAARLVETKFQRRLSLRIAVNVVVTKSSLDFAAELAKLMPEEVPIGIVPFIVIPSYKLLAELPSRRELEELRKEVRGVHPNSEFPYLAPPPPKNCRSDIYSNVYIRYDGMVSPCCFLAMHFPSCTYDGRCGTVKPFFLGSALEKSLEEILRGERFSAFSAAFKKGRIPEQCALCNSWRMLP